MHSENDKKVAAFTRSRFLKDSAEALREAGILYMEGLGLTSGFSGLAISCPQEWVGIEK